MTFDSWILNRVWSIFMVFDFGIHRADSRLALSQWETVLLCNDISHWLGANLEHQPWIQIYSNVYWLKIACSLLGSVGAFSEEDWRLQWNSIIFLSGDLCQTYLYLLKSLIVHWSKRCILWQNSSSIICSEGQLTLIAALGLQYW